MELSRIALYGCGIIATSDLFLYLTITRPYKKASLAFKAVDKKGNLLREKYLEFVSQVNKQYVYVFPKVGIPNIELVIALNRYFFDHQMEYKARLGYLTDEKKLLQKMIMMLQRDLPIILLIGMPMPQLLYHTVWSKKNIGIPFYTQIKEKDIISYKVATSSLVKGHFVVVTGILIDKEATDKKYKVMLRISSWGKEYYMSYYEYCQFEMKYGVSLQGSIIHISFK